MNNPNSGKKVHASFSGGEPAATCFEIPQMVAKAGYTFTGTHSAQPDKWYEIWKAKLLDALFVIVVFSDVYRNRFTKALKKEADAIIELLEQNAIAVYIFDPDAKGSASDIFMNLDEQSLVMGDLSGWVDFVENTIPINLDIPLPPPSSMSSPGYRSPSKRVSSKSPVRKHVGNLHQNSNEFSDNQYFEDEDRHLLLLHGGGIKENQVDPQFEGKENQVDLLYECDQVLKRSVVNMRRERLSEHLLGAQRGHQMVECQVSHLFELVVVLLLVPCV